MNKFEKLIEYVINDEDNKAQDLFHEIVVEKSREIYESLMDEDAVAQDEVDDLVDDIEADEEGVAESEDDDMEMIDSEEEAEVDYDMDGEQDEHEGDHEELEDRVVDLEDKLDELMAEFEELMGGEEAPAEEPAMGMEPEMEGMFEAEEEITEDDAEDLEEATSLKPAPAPTKTEAEGTNKKSINADNSGKDGAEADPVAMGNSAEEKGRPAPAAKDLGATPTQEAGSKAFKSAAPKAKTGEESGTNSQSLVK